MTVTRTLTSATEKTTSTWEFDLDSADYADRLMTAVPPFVSNIFVDRLVIEVISGSGDDDMLIVSALGRSSTKNQRAYKVFANPSDVRTADISTAPAFIVSVLTDTLPSKFHHLLPEAS